VDEKLVIIWSKDICPSMECDWSPDCQKGYVCTYPPYEVRPVCNNDPNFGQCNITSEIVIGKTYDNITEPFKMGPSSNRCINVNCTKTLDCQSNVTCWNASACGGPFCNNTDVYRYFDEAKQDLVTIPAEGLCGGFDCLNDDICYYGCANATSCLFYYEYCNNSYQVKVWNETTKARDIIPAKDRCENTPCMVDGQCASNNDCFNGTCTSSRNFCNKTASF
jgi:hypothetical protein